jgi:hypothetical protein
MASFFGISRPGGPDMTTFRLRVIDIESAQYTAIKFDLPGNGYSMIFNVEMHLFHFEIIPNLSNMSNLLALMRYQGRMRR